MKSILNKTKKVALLLVCAIIVTSNICYATNAYIPSNNYAPNYSPYYNPYYQGNIYNLPANSYYYIAGYDRTPTEYYNGYPMISRVPIIAGSDYFSARIANGIIYSAYGSISKWCDDYVLTKEGVQAYYLNYARIVSDTSSSIELNVNCSLKRGGIISGYMEFRIYVDINNNRYDWKKLNADGSVYTEDSKRCYDDYDIYDYDDRRIIIIR